MYRKRDGELQVLLVHPGGPYFVGKDEGAWSIPKGEVEADEELFAAARREFAEELGFEPSGSFIPLTAVKQKGGKIVHAWAFAGDCEPTAAHCNQFKIQWPPRSGKWISVPEIDQAEFFDLPTARRKINAAQVALLEELEGKLKEEG